MLEVTTRSGSIYHIDQEQKTWARVSKTEDSGICRTESGNIIEINVPQIGSPLTIVTDRLSETPSDAFRILLTSNVVDIKEIK